MILEEEAVCSNACGAGTFFAHEFAVIKNQQLTLRPVDMLPAGKNKFSLCEVCA